MCIAGGAFFFWRGPVVWSCSVPYAGVIYSWHTYVVPERILDSRLVEFDRYKNPVFTLEMTMQYYNLQKFDYDGHFQFQYW
jgi:hypothetical protein